MFRRSKLIDFTLFATSLLVGSLSLATSAAAQGIAGVVRDSVTGRPISSAVLTLLDSSGAPVTRNLTNERGEYRILLIGAGRSLRVVRIGFEPWELAVPTGIGEAARIDFRLLALPSMLRPVRVIANSNCPERADAASALGLWEQARAGLLATVVSRQQNPASILRLISQQLMDGNSDHIQTMRVRADSSVDTISFVAARSAEDFVNAGFRHDSAEIRTTFGPDAVVLLSDDFAAAYCFQLAAGGRARPRQVGIRFRSAVSNRDRTDIDGTLWIDTTARELRDVEFVYLGVPGRMEAFHPGGRVSFHAMPNGEVLVDRWSIRSVSVAYDTVWSSTGGSGWSNGGGSGQSLIGNGSGGVGLGDPRGSARVLPTLHDHLRASVTGGELARASWPDGLVWRAPLGTLRVHAVTARGQPAVGSIVELVATPYFGVVDSTGTAEITGLLPGPYAVRIVDPRFAELGIGVPTPLKFTAFRDSTTTKTLKVPTAEDFIAARCIAAHQWTPEDSVFVFGRVVTPDGQPVSNVTVGFSSGAYVNPEFFVTGTDGLFQSCRPWHLHDSVTIAVRHSGMVSSTVTRTFDSNLAVVRIVVQPMP